MTAPTLPREDALLAELDSLSFSGRIRRAAAVGRAHAADPALPALLDALLAGDAYRGTLAVWMAQAARRLDRLAAALAHRSLLVRRLATLELARLVPDAPDAPGPAPAPPGAAAGASPGEGGGEGVPGAAEVAGLVHAAAPALRRELLKGLVREGKHGLARSLFDEVLARYGPAEAAPLLASLDDGALRARLPELAHAVAAWRPLFSRHPEAVLAYLVDRLEASPPRERPLVLLRHAALAGAA
ncbi:MAG TPA: hypothetical protein VFS00_17365, partial [Polyangiaceae bacterium]|nr:hypothetical protein [Polyangiaceae bacterium]